MPRSRTGPPADLDEAARKLYRRVKDRLELDGLWENVTIPTVERYCRATQDAREARRRLAHFLVDHPDDATVRGSHGQPTAHPDLKVIREAEKDAQQYAEALLLTPAARKRVGLESEPYDPDDPLMEPPGGWRP